MSGKFSEDTASTSSQYSLENGLKLKRTLSYGSNDDCELLQSEED
jgi:hypothetical protein